MATTLIGTLRPHAKGVHVQANAYNIMDVVTSADGSRAFMAVQDVPAGTALDNAAYWCIYTDVSAVKTEMEAAAERADASAASANEAILNLTDYTSEYALRVRGEIAESAGNPVTIAPDEGSLMRPVTVFSPKQTGSGDPSPDNERPISGYDALGLTRCGKNLLKRTASDNPITDNGVTITPNSDGTYTLNGTATGDIIYNIYVYYGMDGLLRPGQRYTASFGSEYAMNGENTVMAIGTELNSAITYLAFEYSKESKTFTMPDEFDAVFVRMRIYPGTVFNNVTVYPHIEIGEHFTGYEPYQGNTYTVQPDHTVYGGRMDWTKGELVAEWGIKTFDGTEEFSTSWSTGLYSTADTLPGLKNSLDTPAVVSSHFIHEIGAGALYTCYIKYQRAHFNYDNNGGNVAGFKAWLAAQYAAGIPVQIVYKLTEPYTIQLTPHQILALKGNNTLYGDGDTIETLWVKPLETSIKERTEPLIERIAALEAVILNS